MSSCRKVLSTIPNVYKQVLIPAIVRNSDNFLEGLGEIQGCCIWVHLFCPKKDVSQPPELSLVLSPERTLSLSPPAHKESDMGLVCQHFP